MRGPLAPADVPLARSRSQRFDDLVGDAWEDIEHRWAQELENVDLAVARAPDIDDRPVAADDLLAGDVPLARVYPATPGERALIVIYRRPIELRAVDRADLADLVHDVLVEQVARLLGVDPGRVDPSYGEPEED